MIPGRLVDSPHSLFVATGMFIMCRNSYLIIAMALGFVLTLGLAEARSLVAEKPAYLSALEQAVLDELNLARTNPQTYAKILEDYRQKFQGRLVKRPGKIDLMTSEGVAAVDEAIRELKARQSLPGLRISRGMSLAAKDHVNDTGPRGLTGHRGSDGSQPFDRMNRHGKWLRSAGENISYGNDVGRDVVIQLIVDDGVAGRGHRKNIYNPAFGVVGIACGAHKTFGTMCVQTFAGDYQEK